MPNFFFHSTAIALTVLVTFLSSSLNAERVALQPGRSFCFFDDLKAKQVWGVQFQSDDQDIKVTVQWMRDNNEFLSCWYSPLLSRVSPD